jgi:hypothetical protein
MEKKTLAQRKIIESGGKLSYTESNQAWGTLRLRSEIINEFKQLKEKMSKFSYQLILYKNYEDFEKAAKEIVKEKGILPILVWLKKEM